MGEILQPTPRVFSFNNKKIIMVFIIIGIIVSGAITYVIYGNVDRTSQTVEDRDKANTEDTDENKIQQEQDTGDDETVNNIMQAAKKNNASNPVTSTDDGSIITPPITPNFASDNNSGANPQDKPVDDFATQVKQIQQQDKLKKLNAKYSAIYSSTVAGVGNSSSESSSTNNGSANSTPPLYASNSTNPYGATGIGYTNNGNKSSVTNSNQVGSDYQRAKSPYIITAGSIIPCLMISGLNSTISGPTIALVTQNIYDSRTHQYIMIPQGSKIIGYYSNQVTYGTDRIGSGWNSLIYPNADSVKLQGVPGSDLAGYEGFSDQVDNHYWQLFGMNFIYGTIKASTQIASQSLSTQNNPAGGGVADAAGGIPTVNVSPTIIIRQGYTFNIILTADLDLPIYKQ